MLAVLVVLADWAAASGRRDALLAVLVAAVVSGAVTYVRHGAAFAATSAVLVLTAGLVSAHVWAGAHPRQLGPYRGWVMLMDDPAPVGSGTRAVVEVEGERFQIRAFGAPGGHLAQLHAGDRVLVDGRRSPLSGSHPRRAQVRHVVGDLTVEWFGDTAPGTPLASASNRMRGLLRAGADDVMAADDAALFTGLVIGDDTRQPATMTNDFRTSGLSHLTAVSGQNVAFMLAVAGVLLRRLPRWWRLAATGLVIGWFAVMTRMEPSVLRASAMAALSAWGFALGRERSPARLLGWAVIVLVLVDPFLVWSVAFWLSTGATIGVTVLAPAIEPRLHGPPWLVPTLAVTIGAQIGVLVPSWLVFHRMPALGLVANLLAVPVAGVVMLIGIPAGLAAALLPHTVALVVMLPASIGTRWVAVVARLAAHLEPHGTAALAGWLIQVLALLALRRWDRRAGIAASPPTMPG